MKDTETSTPLKVEVKWHLKPRDPHPTKYLLKLRMPSSIMTFETVSYFSYTTFRWEVKTQFPVKGYKKTKQFRRSSEPHASIKM